MKISSTKKAAILATVLGGFMLGASAEAAKLGIVTASDYSTSHMGAIEGSYINSDDIKAIRSVITGLNRDPAVYNTVDPITGKSSLYIRQYNYSTTNLQNSYAFDAQGNWQDRAVGNTSGAVNAHDVVRYNNYVYVTSYDEGTVGIAKVEGGNILDIPSMTINLKEDLKTYRGIEYADKNASLHGEGLVIVDGALYVIANVNPKGGYTPYDPSYLFKYVIQEDGSLSFDGCTTMGKNTDSVTLNVYNNYILANAIGGYQFYGAENSNAETSINVATMHPEYNYLQSSRTINLPENLYTVRNGEKIPKSEFRSLKVLPNGTAYVMTYYIGKAGKNLDVRVYQTTVSNLLSSKPQNWKEVFHEEAAPGWFGRLDAEVNTKRLWVQVGNKLHIYTDGATDPKVFGTDSFAASGMYEELYTWDIISTDIIPDGKLVKLKLNTGETKVNEKALVWNDDYTNVIEQGRIKNVTGNVTIENNANPLIHLDKNVEGNLTNNVLAGIYAEGVNTNVISNNGLQIQVENNIASPVGIYAGNGGSVKYYGSNADLNIITKTMDGGNTLTNAVLLDPSVNGGESITINAKATNITMEGGYGGNGVAIKKTDRWGENSKASTQGGKITITGDLNIKGKDNETWGIEANPTNVLSRFNNAGILVDVNNSSVTVEGNVDMDVYGNGVTVTGKDSTVTIVKGGSITVPTGTEYGYYALAAYDGTINMNANAGANAVKLDGDIFVTSEGKVNLGLATNDSYLKGIIDNGGTANLTLKNSAVWTNEANNTRYYQDNEDKGTDDQRSHVTNLTGGTTFDDAGTIVQTANSKLLYIDNLDGAVKINYTGQDVTDTNPETKLNNGVTIAKAVEGSQIALFTSNAGIKTDDEKSVNAVLNALANKLYYTAYVTGERNLTGVAVGMDEGLTASSVTKQANIQFIETTGQGSLSGSASDGTGINPDTGVENEGSNEEESTPEVVVPSKVDKNGLGSADGGAVRFTNFEGHGVTVNGGYTMMYSGGWDEYVTIGVANGTDNNYYALNAKDGTIVAGVGQGSQNNYCQLQEYLRTNITGDIYASEKGEIHLGLWTCEDCDYDSSFTGAVINNEGGIVDLQIGAEAEWTHIATNENNKFATSYINILGIGTLEDYWCDNEIGTGIIRQTPESGDIVVEKLGSTYIGSGWLWNGEQGAADAKIYYTLDAANPTDVKGGSVVINSAVAGSKITLAANYVDGINATNLQNVFNSLANKLYYLGYIYNTDKDGNVLDANGNKLDNDGNIVDSNGKIVGKAEEFVPAHRESANNLTAYVQIGEGLTASSIAQGILEGNSVKDSISNVEVADGQASNSITFEDGSLNAGIRFNGTTGQGSLTGKLEHGTGMYEDNQDGVAFIDENGAYTRPIYGTFDKDTNYVGVDVLKNGVYEFTKAVNVFNTDNKKIDGGAWHQPVAVGISAHGLGNVTNVNMNNNDLVMTNKANGSGAAITAIDEGIININNPGNIIINQLGQGLNAGIFANSGGEVYINNAETGGLVTIRTEASGANGAGIKTMNGVDGVHSKVVITGMADIVADLNTGNNEALSAVASIIEVGGGNIAAVNGAWAAIRAYGEFVSNNTAIVNVNVVKKMDANGDIVKDADGYEVIEGAGNNKTTIYGDFVTNGGMGTLGYINVGLNGADSKWEGNYADCRGYGVTLGQDGQVNLFMKNGAKWEGFSDGEMNVTMEGEGTTWYGFNVSEHKYDGGPEDKTLTGSDGKTYTVPRETINGGLTLTLKDKALWVNAFSSTQKDAAMSRSASLVYNFIGDDGFIDMTGNKLSIASNSTSHQAGSNGVADQRQTSFTEIGKGETGDLVITNYSGDTTVIYRRDDKNVTEVLGGTTTIKSASKVANENSQITLSTDSVGLDMTNVKQVETVLGNLAEKLYYNAYTTGERNLDGKVQIAEGLTTSSVGKYVGTIEFDANNNGQGGMKDGSLTKPGNTPTVPPSGDEDDEKPEDKPVVPEVKPEQKPVVEEEIKGAITGESLTDKTDKNPYKDLVGKDDKGNDVIDFGKLDKEDSKVDIVKIESEEEGGKNSVIAAAPSKPVIIDVAGKDLAVNGSATSEALGIQAIGGDVTIKDAGYVTITANAGETGSASAIYAKDGDVTIENSDTVKLIAKGNANDAVLHADTNSNVNIKGKVEITDTNGKVAVEVTDGSTVALGGGVIGDKDTVAIAVKDGGSIEINKEGGQSVVINGKIVLGTPKGKMMMMKAAPKAIVVPAGASSFNLTDDQSSMNDDVQYTGIGNNDFVAGISNGAKWTGNSVGGVDLDVFLADGGAWTGYHEDVVDGSGNVTNKFNMDINSGATWTNTAKVKTTIDKMSGEGGFVEMSEGDLAIGTYNGKTTFVYAHNYGKDVKDEDLIKGGDVTITAVTGNSNIATMRTNNIGTSDKGEVDRVLKALAEKLAYTGYASNKDALTGKVQIMEGMTGSSVTREGQIKFDDTTGKGSLDTNAEVKVDYTGDYIYGDSETAMMKGAKSAMASTVMMWRSESNDLLQRMGDVRLATEESGVWAKYYGGKYEMDAQNTNFSTSYKAYQVGYDKAVGNGWNVGVAVSHNEGDSRYDRGGEGEMTVTSLSVYGNKDYGDGRYLGLIFKGSQLKNEYEVFNNDGYKLEGDFKTWGTSISAEYGKRIEKGNGFYFDPSVELTIGHVQGKDYTATSDMLAAYGKTATMQVEQDDFNSIIGRVGFGIGQRTDKASYYAKLALAHEFGGDFDTNYTAEETKGTSISFGDTWYEMQLGGTAKLSDNSLLYATYERSFGGDVTEKWRVDAGLRVTF